MYDVSHNDFLKYHNIVSNIKSDWKRKLKDEDFRNLPLRRNKTLYILTQEKQSINKHLYNIRLNAVKTPVIKSEAKWTDDFPQEQLNWSQYYQMSRRKITKFFNYKYLMRIVPNVN